MPHAASAPIDPQRVVIIPSYNSGPLLEQTVRSVLAFWRPVVVILDGSTDGSGDPVVALSRTEPGLHVLAHTGNSGKGAAVHAALNFAADRCWTHAAVFDADGQHEAADLPRFMQASRADPQAMIMGTPVFGPDAPPIRVLGHRVADFWARLETPGSHLGDSLFGFRVYPVLPAIKVMQETRGGRGFDFDTQLAVRLAWAGLPVISLTTPVRYPLSGGNGVSHFHYLRDNLLLIRTHASLLLHAPARYRRLIAGSKTRPA